MEFLSIMTIFVVKLLGFIVLVTLFIENACHIKILFLNDNKHLITCCDKKYCEELKKCHAIINGLLIDFLKVLIRDWWFC